MAVEERYTLTDHSDCVVKCDVDLDEVSLSQGSDYIVVSVDDFLEVAERIKEINDG